MKKIMIICAGLMIFSFTTTRAQAILDKIDRATDRADRAGRTADRTKNTGDKILGFFGKKKDGAASASETKTTVKLSGVDFAALKNLNEKLQTAKGIQSTKMKYSNSGSSITLYHTGSTSDILKTLQKASPSVFAEKNIDGMDDGEISVKLK